jgi:hypothetical protein
VTKLTLRHIVEHLIENELDRVAFADSVVVAGCDASLHDDVTGEDTPWDDVILAACLDLSACPKCTPHHDLTQG